MRIMKEREVPYPNRIKEREIPCNNIDKEVIYHNSNKRYRNRCKSNEPHAVFEVHRKVYKNTYDVNDFINRMMTSYYTIARFTHNILPNHMETGPNIYLCHIDSLQRAVPEFYNSVKSKITHYSIEYKDKYIPHINKYEFMNNIISLCTKILGTIFYQYQVLIFVKRFDYNLYNCEDVPDNSFEIHILLNPVNIETGDIFYTDSYEFMLLVNYLSNISIETTGISIDTKHVRIPSYMNDIKMMYDENFILNCEYMNKNYTEENIAYMNMHIPKHKYHLPNEVED